MTLTLIAVCVFWLWPLFGQIKGSADNFILQKKRLAELEIQKENLRIFAENRETYQASLERIDDLFVSAKEPVNFIEFLENEADLLGLSIEISPLAPQKTEEDLWQSIWLQLLLEGGFSGVAQFLERLEYSDYLLQSLNISISKMEKEEEKISATLTVKVYLK